MPPHIEITDTSNVPAVDISIALAGGETSATSTYRIWNDRLDAEVDTTTATGLVLKLLASDGAAYVSEGLPILDGRWPRVRIIGTVNNGSEVISEQITATLPIGTNATIPLDDIPPQCGRVIELTVITPGGIAADSYPLKLRVVGNQQSSPLSERTAVASGSGVIPADRSSRTRSLVSGSVITADDTDTVVISRGRLTYDGTIVAFPAESETFNLTDGAAGTLGAGEDYEVTVSRDSAGVVTYTKAAKAAGAFPATPAGEVFVGYLMVASADGIAVTVAPASVDQDSLSYAEMTVRDGGSLTATVDPGDGITDSDHRQYLSHAISVALADTATNYVWRNADGSITDNTTGIPPEIGADLLAEVDTSGGAIDEIRDRRRLLHPAILRQPLAVAYSAVLSTASLPLLIGSVVLDFDAELEDVALDLLVPDGTWDGDAVKVDVHHWPAGATLGAAGTTIYTSSGTDDARPVIAFDATNLRNVSDAHEVRRFLRGARLGIYLVEAPSAPAPETAREIRVTLSFRRSH